MMRAYKARWGDGYEDVVYFARTRREAGGRALADLQSAGLWRPGLSLSPLRIWPTPTWSELARQEPDGPAHPYPDAR